MKKHILTFFLMALMLVLAFQIQAFAAEAVGQGSCGESAAWTLYDDGTLNISGSGAMYDYVNYADAPEWWDERSQIVRVEIQPGITTIGNFMFAYSENLQDISIPDTVVSVGEYAVRGCASLEQVVLPEGVTQILEGAFYDCDALTSISIPESVQTIGGYAFAYSELLPEVTLPGNLNDLGTGVFRSCVSLQNIYISLENPLYSSVDGVLYNKGITKIVCFPSGRGETGFTIPNSVKTIGDSAFYDCEALTSVTIPEGVTTIENNAFYRCHRLGRVNFPKSLRSIGVYSFYACWSLIEVGLPYGVETISSSAFYDCANLQRIVIPDSVTSLGQRAFYACISLKEITLPNSISSIGDMTFFQCGSLEAIYIPKGITSCSAYAFYECTSLATVYYGGDEAQWTSLSKGVALPEGLTVTYIQGSGTCGTYLTWYLEQNGRLTISGRGEMDDFSLERSAPWSGGDGQTNFSEIRVSVDMTSIGDYAFSGASIKRFDSGPGIRSIGDFAFASCPGLEKVIVASPLEYIGEGAFSGCKALTEIEVSADNPSFTGKDGVLFSRDMAELICYPANKSGSKYEIPAGVSHIAPYAFDFAARLSEVTLPGGIREIGAYAFHGCEALGPIAIPGGVNSIGEYAFYNCGSLSSFAVSSDSLSFVSDGGVLFTSGKEALICYPAGKNGSGYVLPASVRSIAKGAFDGCAGLKTVTISDGVQIIPEHAFSGCTGLEEVSLSKNIRQIGAAAFDTCVSLNTVHFGGSEAMWQEVQIGEGNPYLTADRLRFDSAAEPDSLIDKYSYSFANSRADFGYPNPYYIPFTSYEIIYGSTTRAQNLYAQHKRTAWNGSCAGIAATSALMAVNDSGVNPLMFDLTADKLNDLEVNDYSSELDLTLTTFIEAMHVTQYSKAFSTDRNKNRVVTTDVLAGRNDLDEFHDELKKQTGNGYPAILALSSGTGIGHAVLACSVEDLPDGTSRILVYDNNYPMEERYLTLEKENSEHYTAWSYDVGGSYGTWGTDQVRSNIAFISYDTIRYIWDCRGNLAEKDNLVTFNSSNVDIYSAEYELLATVESGVLYTYDPDISSVDREISLVQQEQTQYTLRMPVATYIIENRDASVETFDVSIVDSELGMSVSTTATAVTLSVDDSHRINTVYVNADEKDTVELVLQSSNSDELDAVSVMGSGTENESLFAISILGKELTYSSVGNIAISTDDGTMKPVSVTATAGNGGKIVPGGTVRVLPGEEITFHIIPDAGYSIRDVLVDGASVGAVDTYTMENISGDYSIEAVFEQREPVNLPGDVNGDGVTDEGDVTALARHLARIEKIEDERLLGSADMNGDLAVDAKDLTKLARYIQGILD